ncbi:DUF3397 family protein [Levilactobacillus brevis]|nr:DUF3397 family protein [Levilactobacillus brevis]
MVGYGWMAIGIAVALLQAIHNKELLYGTFLRTFWRLTDLYWTAGFACLLLTGNQLRWLYKCINIKLTDYLLILSKRCEAR